MTTERAIFWGLVKSIGAAAFVLTGTRVLPALMTIAGGLFILFCVGFVQTPAVHNGAHDTRHANGFPCH
jgi:cobalt transporter subunit CbtB